MSESTQTHTPLALLGPAEPAPLAVVEGHVVDYTPPSITKDEEDFALAIVESSGNISAAYRMVFGQDEKFPLARGKELLNKPGVIMKIKAITDAVEDASLISVSAHLDQLARIRDLSIVTGNVKTALAAERSRGEAVGIYQRHDKGNGKGGNTAVQINIAMASPHDVDI
jgi:hypothetical protein